MGNSMSANDPACLAYLGRQKMLLLNLRFRLTSVSQNIDDRQSRNELEHALRILADRILEMRRFVQPGVGELSDENQECLLQANELHGQLIKLANVFRLVSQRNRISQHRYLRAEILKALGELAVCVAAFHRGIGQLMQPGTFSVDIRDIARSCAGFLDKYKWFIFGTAVVAIFCCTPAGVAAAGAIEEAIRLWVSNPENVTTAIHLLGRVMLGTVAENRCLQLQ